jgi:hypothetical protein
MNLEIELGRCKNIPRNQRHCKLCKTLDDEFHFFFDCKVTDNIRPSPWATEGESIYIKLSVPVEYFRMKNRTSFTFNENLFVKMKNVGL